MLREPQPKRTNPPLAVVTDENKQPSPTHPIRRWASLFHDKKGELTFAGASLSGGLTKFLADHLPSAPRGLLDTGFSAILQPSLWREQLLHNALDWASFVAAHVPIATTGTAAVILTGITTKNALDAARQVKKENGKPPLPVNQGYPGHLGENWE